MPTKRCLFAISGITPKTTNSTYLPYYYYTIKIGGKSYLKITNTKPVELSNVKVYAGSPWYTARKGMIRNFEIEIKVPVETAKPSALGSCVIPGKKRIQFSISI